MDWRIQSYLQRLRIKLVSYGTTVSVTFPLLLARKRKAFSVLL